MPDVFTVDDFPSRRREVGDLSTFGIVFSFRSDTSGQDLPKCLKERRTLPLNGVFGVSSKSTHRNDRRREESIILYLLYRQLRSENKSHESSLNDFSTHKSQQNSCVSIIKKVQSTAKTHATLLSCVCKHLPLFSTCSFFAFRISIINTLIIIYIIETADSTTCLLQSVRYVGGKVRYIPPVLRITLISLQFRAELSFQWL